MRWLPWWAVVLDRALHWLKSSVNPRVCMMPFVLSACVSPTAAAPEYTSSVLPIASTLQQVVQRMQHDGVTAVNVRTRQPETYSTPVVHVDAWGRLHTAILVTEVNAQAEAALTAHAVVIEHAVASLRLIQAWVPFDRLTTIAALPFVRALRPPSYASRR